MPFTAPDASALGCQLRQLLELGAPDVIVGRYAAAQCTGTLPAWPAEQLEQVAQALKMLNLSGAEGTLLGQFASVQVASLGAGQAVNGANALVLANQVPAAAAPSAIAPSLKEEVAQLVAAELARGKTRPRAAGDRSTVLKVSMGGGRYTSVSVPKDLHARFVKTFGSKAAGSRELAAMLASTTSSTAAIRSRQIQDAMEAALQAHQAANANSQGNVVQLRRG